MRINVCKISIALICILLSFDIKVADVTLISAGDGATKELAVKNAIMASIEQAYGVYVSSNATILNDELIRDEVVEIKRGNIKNYTILNEAKVEGNKYSVILEATIRLINQSNHI